MRIVVCYKLVPEEQDIAVKSNQTLDFANAEWKIGSYDLNAVEAGMAIADAGEAEVIALTVGGAMVDNSKLRKGVLSRGPHQQYSVMDEKLASADSIATARVLKAAIEKIGNVDLVICGEGSGDIYSQQTGTLLASLMGWSASNAVDGIETQANGLKLTRELEECTEIIEVSLPAVISVTSTINTPRIAGMKDILGAGKKPATTWSLEEAGISVENANEVVSVLAPPQADRLKIILEGASDDTLNEFVGYLRKAI
jgi:electron transfer flavoprotein beta subunit